MGSTWIEVDEDMAHLINELINGVINGIVNIVATSTLAQAWLNSELN